MNSILVLLRKDFALLLRDKVSIMITFAVPFAMIYLFGLIFNVNGTDTGPTGIPFAVVNQSDNPASATLVAALKAEKAFKIVTEFRVNDTTTRPLTEEDLRPLMRADRFRFALVIPEDLVRTDAIGLHLKTYSNPRNDIESQMVNGILQRTLFSNVPELLGQSLQARARSAIGDARTERFDAAIASAVAREFGGDEAAIRRRIADGNFGFDRLGRGAAGAGRPQSGLRDVLSSVVKIDNTQVAGNDVKSPQATLLVGGWAIQFLLFAVTASATALFREKEHGIFQRLLSAPVRRSDILWSKFLYGICLGLIQLVTLFSAGQLLYKIDVGSHLPLLAVVCVFAAAACTSFGMLIAAISPTQESARGLSTFVIMLMSAIGGAWFPVSFMPEFIQRLSRLTLVYWSMEGFSQVLWAHASLVELLPTLGCLSLTTALIMAVSVWRFNKGRIFE
jgi:ABC-2 type transport system permease protein